MNDKFIHLMVSIFKHHYIREIPVLTPSSPLSVMRLPMHRPTFGEQIKK